MTIAFHCPHCDKAYKVKEELAGKKATCTQCRKPMQIPKPARSGPDTKALEALATSALSDEPPPVAAAVVDAPIRFECPYCFEVVEFAAAQAGKRAPCPSCRHIIPIPQPKAEAKRDWRDAEKLPSLAKRDVGPAPEGAWGNTTGAAVVSREALKEAKALPDRRRRPPKSWGPLAAATVAVAVVAAVGLFYWTKSATAEQRHDLVKQAIAELNRDDAKFSPGAAVAVRTRGGEFFLHDESPDLKAAVTAFKHARAGLHGVDLPLDKALLTLDLAVAQTRLGGDENQVRRQEKMSWDEVQRELRQTVQQMRELPREAAVLVLEQVARELVTMGERQQQIARALAVILSASESERAESLAIVGLEALASGEAGRPFAAALAEEARQLHADGSPPPARLIALLVALKHPQAQQLAAEPRSGAEPPPAVRLGWAEGLARTGDPADRQKAREIAQLPGAAEPRLLALTLIANSTMIGGDENPDEIREAAEYAAAQLKTSSLSPFTLARLGQAARKAGRPDLIRRVADLTENPTTKAWLLCEAERAAEPTPPPWEAIEQIGEKDSPAKAVAAAERMRRAVSAGLIRDPVKSAAGLTGILHPAALTGAALGYQKPH